jgi:photosystem II stability/assembly factor-like uncharacterized protein
MSKRIFAALLVLCLLPAFAAPVMAKKTKKDKAQESEEAAKKAAKKAEDKSKLNAGTLAGLTLRSIGPALVSGRVIDLAVDPDDPTIYYVAVASGGVWKTTNAGTTYQPIFDGEASYSIGCITLDPNNPNVLWVGSGENNSQRSVGYGDGVYKSLDGGASWKNMGLKSSEHIAKILVDPRDSNVVWVAAQGPLWTAGGDRGLYKTTDGGETWEAVLAISENTGITDIAFDPRDPDVVYAAAYQRRRRVWTLVDGGPEGGLRKTTDGGKSWREINSGLPKVDIGRIGLTVSPADPDVVYAIVEAADDKGGFFRSRNRGESWEKRSDYVSGSPQYYQELFADPYDVDRVYSMDTFMQVSEDGGASFEAVGEIFKHVDNHALWIDPDDTRHLLVGCDGGLYETFDRGATWDFKPNLPVTQFYKITADNAFPFYNVYGGTQDNFSLGAPNQTATLHGIRNSDWTITLGGDGFETVVDPQDPNILYSQYQHAGLTRFDKASGEQIDIQPQPAPGDPPLRWNWDSPLIISPHSHTRLYFGAQRIFRSDDRGDSWRPVSPDLTRQIDRNRLEVMGRVWSVDAVAKNSSTSVYGNLVALTESPVVDGLLYSGSDDGLISVSEDGGENWRSAGQAPGVPERTYVNRLEASSHDADTVYAAFNAHKDGDFKPYLFKSTDRGRSWSSITGDLPERGSTYVVLEDTVDAKLLFAGTEFGVYASPDGGGHWLQLTGGMPTIAVRDLAIQPRENDLVVGTFGRGIYILDDYSPLRGLSEEALTAGAKLFPVAQAWMYIPALPLGLPDHAFMGHGFYTGDNPPFGAVFTYYLQDGLETRKDQRMKAEGEKVDADEPVYYPSWDELRQEDREKKPQIVLTVRDVEGDVVRRVTGPSAAGMHRVAWDLRYPATDPVDLSPRGPYNPFADGPQGPLVPPGTYSVSVAKLVDGEVTELAGPVSFETTPLGNATLPASDRAALAAFQAKVSRLNRAVRGAAAATREAHARINHLEQALADTPGADLALAGELLAIEHRLDDLEIELFGDRTVASRSEPTSPSILNRVGRVIGAQWGSTSAPTTTSQDGYQAAAAAFAPLLEKLRTLVEGDLTAFEQKLEAAGAPWTPGRLPNWTPE